MQLTIDDKAAALIGAGLVTIGTLCFRVFLIGKNSIDLVAAHEKILHGDRDRSEIGLVKTVSQTHSIATAAASRIGTLWDALQLSSPQIVHAAIKRVLGKSVISSHPPRKPEPEYSEQINTHRMRALGSAPDTAQPAAVFPKRAPWRENLRREEPPDDEPDTPPQTPNAIKRTDDKK